jgi:CRISPR-associated protein Cmr4
VQRAFGTQSAAGDWTFTDLRILCLPVRSFYGVFAYVTCPLVLQRLTQVAKRLDINIELGEIPSPNDTEIALADESVLSRNSPVYLEELDLIKSEQDATTVAEKIAKLLFGNDSDGSSLFRARFAIVSDQAFNYFSETATEVAARVRLHENKKTVITGALWYEECVPAESIFYGFATHVKPPELRLPFKDSLAGELLVQVGGDATIGRGISRVVIV